MIKLTVNGETSQYEGDGEMPLLWYLRDLLTLTGTKYGCGKGLHGACTVKSISTASCRSEFIRSYMNPDDRRLAISLQMSSTRL